ncbi:MAG: transposase, partial [Verrucomicrobia bacterium]|nr:transposase [Verrucomicrobiota bacterium]
LLINRRGSIAGGEPGAERALRVLTRHRKAQVRLRTATGNRIHQIVDQLFPGFLDERLSSIPPFSEASLYLMGDRFSPAHLSRRQDKALLRQLKACGLQQAEAALGKLKAYARQVLAHPPELTGLLQTSLASEINLYRCLGNNIGQIGREIAQQLAKTPGAMLTTIRGIGITLAAGASAEIGPPDTQPSVRRLGSYAGIVPRVKQTGGPEKGAKTGKVSRRCNHVLKDYIVQCGNHLGLHGPADLKEDHRRRGANGQHADFGMARRCLRMAMRLMRNPRRTPHLLSRTLAQAPRQMDQSRSRPHRLRLRKPPRPMARPYRGHLRNRTPASQEKIAARFQQRQRKTISTAETPGWLFRTVTRKRWLGSECYRADPPPFILREALLKGTLTRLRPGAKTMSRQTSLQRADQKSPECHHPFPTVGTPSKPTPEATQKSTS